MRPLDPNAPLLALDTGSPTTSIAIGRGGTVLAERQLPLRRSSEQLLRAIEEALDEASLTLDNVGGLVVLRGPGSFTGLRVGLATVMGLHQARGWPTAVLSTHHALAAAAGDEPGLVIAAVDALRGEWHIRRFEGGSTPRPLDSGARVPTDTLTSLPSCRLVAVDLESQLATLGLPSGVRTIAPPHLARYALALADHSDIEWDPTLLTQPIYFRAPAVTIPTPSGSPSVPPTVAE